MGLLSALGLKEQDRFAPTTDVAPLMKRAVAKVATVKDPKARAEGTQALKAIEAERRQAMALVSPTVRDKALAVLSTRLKILIGQVGAPPVKPVCRGDGPRKMVRYRIEDRFKGTTNDIGLPDGDDNRDAFELDGMPRGRFAFRLDGGRAAVEQPEPDPQPQSKPKPRPPPPVPQPKPEPPKEDEARRKRREKALKDIEEAKNRWAEEDPLIVEYFKKDFADVTLTEGMENVSTVTGVVGTAANLVPGGQGLAACMELVGLTADVANTTYVVTKALLFDPEADCRGKIAEKGMEKLSKALLDRTKKTIVKKLKGKYPGTPEPLLEKLVDEAVDRIVGKLAEEVGDKVREGIDEHSVEADKGKTIL